MTNFQVQLSTNKGTVAGSSKIISITKNSDLKFYKLISNSLETVWDLFKKKFILETSCLHLIIYKRYNYSAKSTMNSRDSSSGIHNSA